MHRNAHRALAATAAAVPRLVCLIWITLSTVSVDAYADAGHGHGHGAQSGMGAPGSVADASRTIDVTMTEYGYDPSSISVRADETVRFVLRNRGRLVHEFNIGTPQAHEAHQAEMLEMLQSGHLSQTEIHSHGKTAHVHANSVLLAPGESEELVWRFGSDVAGLEFACNVPGHYQAGMVGRFTRD